MSTKPFLWAALGSRGTGKSAWVKRQVDQLKPARLAVWDLMKEYPGGTEDLGQAIRAMGSKGFRMVFWPSRDDDLRAQQFDLWCRALLASGQLLAIVEELAFVTRPSKAPPGWRELSLLGRHPMHAVSIIGTSQRPAQIDKDFLGNCDLIHCGRLGEKPDAQKAAAKLNVRFEELMLLPDLHWVERHASSAEATRGVLSFGASRPPSGQRPKAVNSRR